MGVVHEVVDCETGEHLARKTLQTLEGQALYRLKNEFRHLRDLRHPNLVRLGELVGRDDTWFITMELVDGVDFLEYVRPRDREAPRRTSDDAKTRELQRTVQDVEGPPTLKDLDEDAPLPLPTRPGSVDVGRLRAALGQLGDALLALHDHGQVHRDLKPSNVLVERSGRVVVLDFGLVAAAAEAGQARRTEDYVVGTVPYMAPEQAAGRPVGAEADWYAVGVMVYEALTGRMPFEGGALQILLAKQSKDPPDPRLLEPDVPADLAELCTSLLARDPARRAGHEAIRAIVGAAVPVSRSSGLRDLRIPFVDREAELGTLRAAFADVCGGRARSVLVRGETGIGKSALADAFVAELARTRPDVIALRSRCRVDETLPFNAIDGLVDGASHALKLLEPRVARAVLPADSALLVDLFPVLERVPAVARVARTSARLPSEERRVRAFEAFRALLRGLATSAPLVIVVDDLQLADRDSLKELAAFLRAADAPPVLFLATARLADTAPLPERLAAILPPDAQVLVLDRLSDEAACTLFDRVADRADPGPWKELVAASSGHPLHLVELGRHARDVGETAPASLGEVLAARLESLGPTERTVLAALSLVPRPLAESAIAAALGLALAEARRALERLATERFVTLERVEGALVAEGRPGPLARIVRDGLPEGEKQALARSLFRALREADPDPRDPSLPIALARLAGDPEPLAELLVASAEHAYRHLAFDRAAELLLEALETRAFEADRGRSMRTLAAQCLENAGDLRAASALFEEVAAAVDEPIERARLLSLAARAASSALDLETLRRAAKGALEALGDTVPTTRAGFVRAIVRLFVGILVAVPWRRVVHERSPERATKHRIRHRIFYALSTGAYLADDTLATLHATLGVVNAGLWIGPSYERVVSLGVLAMGAAVAGLVRLLERLLRASRRDAEAMDDPRGLGAHCFVGTVAYSKAGLVEPMLRLAEEARAIRASTHTFEYLSICARVAYVQAARGRPLESIEWYERAFDRVPADRDDPYLGLCQDVYETQRALAGRSNEARKRATAAIARHDFGTTRGRMAIGNLLLLAREEGDADAEVDALLELHEAHALGGFFVPDEELLSRCVATYVRLDRALERGGRPELERLRAARRDYARVARDPTHRVHLAVLDAGLALATGRRARASTSIARAEREAALLGHAWMAIEAALLGARLAASVGDAATARERLASAAATARQHGHRLAEGRIERLAVALGLRNAGTNTAGPC